MHDGLALGYDGFGWFGLMVRTEANDTVFKPSPETNPDRADIAAARAGDGDAYARLIARHQTAIGAYMWRFVRDKAACEELTHDVFVEAYLSLRTFRGDAPFLHWLRKIATRVGYRYWKRTAQDRARLEAILEAHRATPVSTPDASWAAEHVHALLARLAPRDRLVLTLLYLEELSVAEAAQATGWGVSLVKVQAYRARRRLKRLMDDEERNSIHG